MAGAPDPLEDMLFSEVDEKAVSDLVGSLESQLSGQSPAAGQQPETRTPGAAISHPSSLAVPVGPRQQQGHPKPVGPNPSPEPKSKNMSAAGTTLPLASTSAGEAAGRRVDVHSSSLQTHGAATHNPTLTAPGAVTLPPLPPSVNSGSSATATSSEPVKNHVAPAVRTAASALQAGNVEAVSPTHTSSFGIAAASSLCDARNPASAMNLNVAVVSSAKSALPSTIHNVVPPPRADTPLDGAHNTRTSQRLPIYISNIAQNGSCYSNVSVVIPSTRAGPTTAVTQIVNHQNVTVGHSVTDSTVQSKSFAHSQSTAVNSQNNAAISLPVINPFANPSQSPSTNYGPVACSTITLNAIAKPALNVIGSPGSAVGIMKPGTATPAMATPAMPTATQTHSPRLGSGSAQRIVAPQLIVRPPQQTTIQLPPGFTIPPGMVLVRTETGQLVMVPQQALAQAHMQAQAQGQGSPRPTVPNSGPVFHLSTAQQPAPIATSTVCLGPPVQAKVVQPAAAAVSSVPASTLHTSSVLSHSPVSLATPSAQTLFKATVTSGSAVPPQPTLITAGHAPSPGPKQPQGQPRLPLPSQAAAQIPAQPQVVPSSPLPGTTFALQEMQENVKKCKNFLATLIKLASHNSPSPETSRNVKSLVQDLLDAKIDPEEFTGRLQSELKSSPQPYLVPFLKKSLPALRQSLLSSQHSVMLGQNCQQQPPQQAKLSQSIPQTASVLTTQAAAIKHPNNFCLATVTNAVAQPPQLKMVPSCQSSQLMIQSTSHTVKHQTTSQPVQVRMPVVATQPIRPQGTAGRAPAIQVGRSPGSFGVQVPANQKSKLNDPGGGCFRDDNDINDVTSMAGIDLNEESARIMATSSDLVGTQTQSCRDEPFLAAVPLHKRIIEIARKFGITDVPADVITFISHATQNRLRAVIEKVTLITQHRVESHKDDEWYEQATDVRSQFKFFEQLERLEKQRKDEEEREMLLKAAKSRSRQEDPEQARLKQKAKEMQQQELAQMRQRDANLTALAAIGPRKKRKLDSPGTAAAGGECLGVSCSGQPGSGASTSRPHSRNRITRINLRDFIFCMEQERETSRSLLLYRALLK
ncbi:transcription initiation factor TFIID subunit 4-like isoform X2 [Rhinatrema bivittatum]|uniref:transcription initiation factor TFIID subunit 4-like isoform X2 n=1 Tax=Rhinatrema bivittatum TaxID=194408 RepID=UPI00112E9FCB|nr:transcription initiation factor TFIID subunit 4-like isoform X2 [Rhinatrema bivittatum]